MQRRKSSILNSGHLDACNHCLKSLQKYGLSRFINHASLNIKKKKGWKNELLEKN